MMRKIIEIVTVALQVAAILYFTFGDYQKAMFLEGYAIFAILVLIYVEVRKRGK